MKSIFLSKSAITKVNTNRGWMEKRGELRNAQREGGTRGDGEMQKEGMEKHTILIYTSKEKHIDIYYICVSAAHLKS